MKKNIISFKKMIKNTFNNNKSVGVSTSKITWIIKFSWSFYIFNFNNLVFLYICIDTCSLMDTSLQILLFASIKQVPFID